MPTHLTTSIKLIIILLLGLSLSSCGDTWQWYVVNPNLKNGWLNLKFLFGGYIYTILMSFVAIAVSLVLGLAVALLAFAKSRMLRAINISLVEVFRSVPPLVMILFVYYGLSIGLNLNLSIFWAGTIALALADFPFMAEVYRTGIQSIPLGQSEGAKAIGLSKSQTMRLVILPQAIRRILPSLANQFILVLKTSSLISVIGYSELTRRANELSVSEYRTLEIYTVLVLEYLILVLALSFAVRWFERYLNRNLGH